MRSFVQFCLLILIISSCNAPINVQTSVPQQSESFNSAQLGRDGLAILPTTSVDYKNEIKQNTDLYIRQYVGEAYLNQEKTARKLNETNMLSTYRDVIDTYQKTGIGETDKLIKIGTALGKRYLMKVDFGKITSKQDTKTGVFDDVESYETHQISVSAIIFDCSNGDIVWEAVSKAKADENNFGSIRQDNNEFVRKSVVGLMKELFKNKNSYEQESVKKFRKN